VNNTIKTCLYFLKIFLILLIIGIILPTVINQILGLLIIEDYNNSPVENSTFVMSYSLFKEDFSFYLRRILLWYICI